MPEVLRVNKNEATAARRYVYFHCVDATDGMTPKTGEAGGQPQVSVDGAAWTNTGIGVLVAIGNGRYYAELTQTLVDVDNAVIETRYKSANTAEAIGSTVRVDSVIEKAEVIRGFFDANGNFTHNITGTLSTLTTYTGNTPQTGDAYGIVTNVTYGNSAIASAASSTDGKLTAERLAIIDGTLQADDYTDPPAAATVAAAVWEEGLAAHVESGMAGEYLYNTSLDAGAVHSAVDDVTNGLIAIAGNASNAASYAGSAKGAAESADGKLTAERLAIIDGYTAPDNAGITTAAEAAAAAQGAAEDAQAAAEAAATPANVAAAVTAIETYGGTGPWGASATPPVGYTRVTHATLGTDGLALGTLDAGTIVDAYLSTDTTYASPVADPSGVADIDGHWYVDVPDANTYTIVGRLVGYSTVTVEVEVS